MHFSNAYKSLMKQGKTTLLEQAKKTHQKKETEKPNNCIIVFPLTIISSKRSVMTSNLNSILRFWFRGNSIQLPLHQCTMATCQLERQSLQHRSKVTTGNSYLGFHYCKSTDLEMFFIMTAAIENSILSQNRRSHLLQTQNFCKKFFYF